LTVVLFANLNSGLFSARSLKCSIIDYPNAII
jgi:hypothetical protein